jgi:hypothetical protein
VATVEYTALAFVVSAALAVAGGAVGAGSEAIPAAVGAELRKAYCLVAGGDCLGRHGPRPCVVGSRLRSRQTTVAIAMVRLRDGRTVLREVLSDGRVRVTVAQGTGAGVAGELGIELGIGGRDVKAGVEVGGGADAGFERTFLAPDGPAADRLIARLDDDDAPVGGAVTGIVGFVRGRGAAAGEASRTVTFGARAQAEVGLRALGLGPRARAWRGMVTGIRLEHASGDRTLLLRLPREAGAELAAGVAGLDGAVTLSREAELTLARDGTPAELVVRVRGEARGEAELPGVHVQGGDLREAEARLDLADPVVRELAGRLAGGDLGAIRALAGRVAAGARVDVRHYTTRRDGSEKGAMAKAGVALGAEHATATETARLVSAHGREPGRGWSERLDCTMAS